MHQMDGIILLSWLISLVGNLRGEIVNWLHYLDWLILFATSVPNLNLISIDLVARNEF